MRIAVVADLHANREAVEAVLEHADAQRVDRYAVVGDCVGYGADPAWVVDRVRDLASDGAIVVMGNHDAAVVRGAPGSMRAEARLAIAWTRAQLDAAQIGFLAALPLTHEFGELLFVHANAQEPAGWGYVEAAVDALHSMRATGRRITFCGHMHEPMLFNLSATGKVGAFVPISGVQIPLLPPRHWLAIPGAVGQPRDGDPAACYAIYDDACTAIIFWRVPYDHEAASAKIRAAGLPLSLASRLADGQ